MRMSQHSFPLIPQILIESTIFESGYHKQQKYTNLVVEIIESFMIYLESNFNQLFRYRIRWAIGTFKTRGVVPFG